MNGQYLCPPQPHLKFIPRVVIKTFNFVGALVEIITRTCSNTSTCLENIVSEKKVVKKKNVPGQFLKNAIVIKR